jgi:hypothetical protein
VSRTLQTGPHLDAGLLRSDANFGDDQLDEVVDCIARCIAEAVVLRGGTPPGVESAVGA